MVQYPARSVNCFPTGFSKCHNQIYITLISVEQFHSSWYVHLLKKKRKIFKKICINIQNLSPTSVCTIEELNLVSNIPYTEGQLDVYVNKKGPFIFMKKAIEKCPERNLVIPRKLRNSKNKSGMCFWDTL